jgi:His-Xaa-Ser system protein HxsD
MSDQVADIEIDEQHTRAKLSIQKKVYSKSAVLRACYWFSRDLWFQIDEKEDCMSVTVGLRVPRPTLSQPNVRKIDEWLPEILNALLDSQLRVEIQAETAGIRELIIAKAFAESGVLEDLPPGTFEDPVGTAHSGSKPLININTESPK